MCVLKCLNVCGQCGGFVLVKTPQFSTLTAPTTNKYIVFINIIRDKKRKLSDELSSTYVSLGVAT